MSDWFYRSGRALLHQAVRLYYRRVEVVGRERIPATGPAIIVANHPNSLADAFLLASSLTPRKLNFIAKDSITRAPVLGWIARHWGVVGVARRMDYEAQQALARERNQGAVNTCVPRLLEGELITIFGEGISDDARRLHPIRTGAMRFGYAAEKGAGFRLGLVWVPVGITYFAKQHFRSDAVIRIGEPFGLSDLAGAAEDEVATVQLGTQRLQRELESLVVNIEHHELTVVIDRLAELLVNPDRALVAQVERQQRAARALQYFNAVDPSRLAELKVELGRYEERLRACGLGDEVIRQKRATLSLGRNLGGLIKSSLLMLLNLYGWANSFIPRWAAELGRMLGRRRIDVAVPGDGEPRTEVAKEAFWGMLIGWFGALVAFPAQTYLVYIWSEARWGSGTAGIVGGFYFLSLLPSWRLFVRRRDILRRQYGEARAGYRFLTNAVEATKLRRQRRHLQRRLLALLADYDRGARNLEIAREATAAGGTGQSR
jgi:1-acyl-sn-glycerol-3-phosphate acyltransferase